MIINMSFIPAFLLGKKYFFQTNEERPAAGISTNFNSVWKKPQGKGPNGYMMVVSVSGGPHMYIFIASTAINGKQEKRGVILPCNILFFLREEACRSIIPPT